MDKIIAIAIDEYSNAPERNLSNCLNDINSIISILTSEYEYDYENSEITLFTEPEQTALSYLYKSLNQEFFNALESDSILIIYAGHGEYNDHLKTGYWYCSDSKVDDPTTWFDINTLISFFLHSKAKHIALISDSCFSGSIFNRNRGGGLNALKGKRSRQALTSGGLEKVSDGNPNDNSPFNKAIQLTLKQNTLQDLSFNLFCEKTIYNFPDNKKQTPEQGALAISGDEGGTYIFKKKDEVYNEQLTYKNMSLALEIDKRIKINSNISIPFFANNAKLDSKYINIFIQNLGFKIINDIRIFASQDIDFLIERSSNYLFEVECNYSIDRLDQDYLSISFSLYEDFGTIHPNYYMYSINFKINPLIQAPLYEVFDINYTDGLKQLINQFAEIDCKDILLNVVDEINTSELDFSFNDHTLYLYFTNHLVHACKACGTVEIPLDKIEFKKFI